MIWLSDSHVSTMCSMILSHGSILYVIHAKILTSMLWSYLLCYDFTIYDKILLYVLRFCHQYYDPAICTMIGPSGLWSYHLAFVLWSYNQYYDPTICAKIVLSMLRSCHQYKDPTICAMILPLVLWSCHQYYDPTICAMNLPSVLWSYRLC